MSWRNRSLLWLIGVAMCFPLENMPTRDEILDNGGRWNDDDALA